MCGIVGVFVHEDNNFKITEPYLNSMRDTMRHRGPDGAGSWISKDGRVGLGHRRLSIIDLSTLALQPMSNEDGSIVIVFNGEIYNHSEIRKELLAIGGHTWKTDHSDTEVIIHAYEQWGIDCIHRFRGMFAFAIWDGRQRCLWLVRDRIGIKPLYWTNADGRFYFASEIKAMIEDKRVPRAISEEAFYHYLTFLTTPAPMTLFEGIYKLPAGYRLQVMANGEIKEEKWWDVFDGVKKDYARSMDDWAAVLLDKLTESVQYRMVSDVPVGVFLSGGIDSSTNAVLFNRLAGGKKIKTFTIGYQNVTTYNNEHKYARQISSMIDSEHHELDLTVKDLIDFLPRLIYHQDEPIADPVCIPIYYVSELARKNGVTVAQVGEGADELFWGYPIWKYSFYLQKMNEWPVPNTIKKLGLDILRAFGKGSSVYYEWLRRGSACQRIFWSGAEAFTEAEKTGFFRGV